MSARPDAQMILVAGPYRSGTDGDPARIAANVEGTMLADLTVEEALKKAEDEVNAILAES